MSAHTRLSTTTYDEHTSFWKFFLRSGPLPALLEATNIDSVALVVALLGVLVCRGTVQRAPEREITAPFPPTRPARHPSRPVSIGTLLAFMYYFNFDHF